MPRITSKHEDEGRQNRKEKGKKIGPEKHVLSTVLKVSKYFLS